MTGINARSIFSPATGFIRRGGFDRTCNPYLGCTFGCTYCYAMYLPQNRRPREQWGRWFAAKVNAVELARRSAPKLAGLSVYVSSVTDPYQPAERALGLTRGILEELIPFQPRVLVQTRGPLVLRDVDLFARLRAVRINLSIPTDGEEVWQAFEPKSPPLSRRWLAAGELKASGIPVGLCLTPLLPITDPPRFADRIAAFGPDVLVVQSFHVGGGAFGADTAPAARELFRRWRWSEESAAEFAELLRSRGLTVYMGEEGFFPPEPIAPAAAPST